MDKWNDAKLCGLEGNWCFVHHCYPKTCRIMGLGEYAAPSAPAILSSTDEAVKAKYPEMWQSWVDITNRRKEFEPSDPATEPTELLEAAKEALRMFQERGITAFYLSDAIAKAERKS